MKPNQATYKAALLLLCVLVLPEVAQARQYEDFAVYGSCIGQYPTDYFKEMGSVDPFKQKSFLDAFKKTVGEDRFNTFMKVYKDHGPHFQLGPYTRAGNAVSFYCQHLDSPEFFVVFFINPKENYLDICWSDDVREENAPPHGMFMHTGTVYPLEFGMCDDIDYALVSDPDYEKITQEQRDKLVGQWKGVMEANKNSPDLMPKGDMNLTIRDDNGTLTYSRDVTVMAPEGKVFKANGKRTCTVTTNGNVKVLAGKACFKDSHSSDPTFRQPETFRYKIKGEFLMGFTFGTPGKMLKTQ